MTYDLRNPTKHLSRRSRTNLHRLPLLRPRRPARQQDLHPHYPHLQPRRFRKPLARRQAAHLFKTRLSHRFRRPPPDHRPVLPLPARKQTPSHRQTPRTPPHRPHTPKEAPQNKTHSRLKNPPPRIKEKTQPDKIPPPLQSPITDRTFVANLCCYNPAIPLMH